MPLGICLFFMLVTKIKMIDYKNNIKVIGFDLDQTLYKKSPEIDDLIQDYIYIKIAEHKQITKEEAKKLFKDLYQDGRGFSGRKSLVELGIPNPKNVIQEALENADLSSVLIADEDVISLLNKIKEKYLNIDIITGSNNSNTYKKLSLLNISKDIFKNIITEDDASKSDGSAYKLWLSKYSFTPQEFLYIGDRVSSDYDTPKQLSINSILINATENKEIECMQLVSLLELENILL